MSSASGRSSSSSSLSSRESPSILSDDKASSSQQLSQELTQIPPTQLQGNKYSNVICYFVQTTCMHLTDFLKHVNMFYYFEALKMVKRLIFFFILNIAGSPYAQPPTQMPPPLTPPPPSAKKFKLSLKKKKSNAFEVEQVEEPDDDDPINEEVAPDVQTNVQPDDRGGEKEKNPVSQEHLRENDDDQTLHALQNVRVLHAAPGPGPKRKPSDVFKNGDPLMGNDGKIVRTSVCDEIDESVKRAAAIEEQLAKPKVNIHVFFITFLKYSKALSVIY